MAMKSSHRFVCYCIIGVASVAIKMCVLSVFIEIAHLSCLVATAIAVETAILHSFWWHLFWTWRERSTGISCSRILSRLARFHIANGAVGFVSNLILMKILVENLGLHYIPSNLAATCIAGLTNYVLADFFVFASATHPSTIQSSRKAGLQPVGGL